MTCVEKSISTVSCCYICGYLFLFYACLKDLYGINVLVLETTLVLLLALWNSRPRLNNFHISLFQNLFYKKFFNTAIENNCNFKVFDIFHQENAIHHKDVINCSTVEHQSKWRKTGDDGKQLLKRIISTNDFSTVIRESCYWLPCCYWATVTLVIAKGNEVKCNAISSWKVTKFLIETRRVQRDFNAKFLPLS